MSGQRESERMHQNGKQQWILAWIFERDNKKQKIGYCERS